MTNFRLFQTKVEDDNFKFDENVRKFSTRAENTKVKGKLDVMSNFSFPPVFQKTCTADT